MTGARTNFVRLHRDGGRGPVATAAAGWLSLAAAPTFALMALWNGLSPPPPDVLCAATGSGSPFDGMTAMYLLMSAFHLPPWLRLIGRR